MSHDVEAPPRRDWSRSSNSYILAVICALAVICIGCAAVVVYANTDRGTGGSSSSEPDTAALKQSGQDACRHYVGLSLKAPATARFSGESSGAAGDTVTVIGAVDSENSFGALLRSNFTCTVSLRQGEWYLDSLSGIN
jgi:hypothetical protein